MGGEKISTTSWPRCWKGSPPRGRGKVSRRLAPTEIVRITPAWAGKSERPPFCYVRGRDHPRVGGEKPDTALQLPSHWGSPPRGRGKAQAFRVRPVGRGITPAWAGKRRSGFVLAPAPTDHPRVGGEKPEWTSLEEIERGSPPRGRGKAKDRLFRSVLCGITPAWAGKSRSGPLLRRLSGDHPRVGGEKHGC